MGSADQGNARTLATVHRSTTVTRDSQLGDIGRDNRQPAHHLGERKAPPHAATIGAPTVPVWIDVGTIPKLAHGNPHTGEVNVGTADHVSIHPNADDGPTTGLGTLHIPETAPPETGHSCTD